MSFLGDLAIAFPIVKSLMHWKSFHRYLKPYPGRYSNGQAIDIKFVVLGHSVESTSVSGSLGMDNSSSSIIFFVRSFLSFWLRQIKKTINRIPATITIVISVQFGSIVFRLRHEIITKVVRF